MHIKEVTVARKMRTDVKESLLNQSLELADQTTDNYVSLLLL